MQVQMLSCSWLLWVYSSVAGGNRNVEGEKKGKREEGCLQSLPPSLSHSFAHRLQQHVGSSLVLPNRRLVLLSPGPRRAVKILELRALLLINLLASLESLQIECLAISSNKL